MTDKLHYYFAIGSNIDPESHIPSVLDAFASVFGQVTLGRLFLTQPVGMDSTDESAKQFLNACFAVGVERNYPLQRAWCVDLCKVIEIQHGRPIDQPNRSKSNRTVDIDFLFTSDDDLAEIVQGLEPYSRLDLSRLLAELESREVTGLDDSSALLTEPGIDLYRTITKADFLQQQNIRFLW